MLTEESGVSLLTCVQNRCILWPKAGGYRLLCQSFRPIDGNRNERRAVQWLSRLWPFTLNWRSPFHPDRDTPPFLEAGVFFQGNEGLTAKAAALFFCSGMAVPGRNPLWKNNTKGDWIQEKSSQKSGRTSGCSIARVLSTKTGARISKTDALNINRYSKWFFIRSQEFFSYIDKNR